MHELCIQNPGYEMKMQEQAQEKGVARPED